MMEARDDKEAAAGELENLERPTRASECRVPVKERQFAGAGSSSEALLFAALI